MKFFCLFAWNEKLHVLHNFEVRCKMYFNKLRALKGSRKECLQYDKREKDRKGKFHFFVSGQKEKSKEKWETFFFLCLVISLSWRAAHEKVQCGWRLRKNWDRRGKSLFASIRTGKHGMNTKTGYSVWKQPWHNWNDNKSSVKLNIYHFNRTDKMRRLLMPNFMSLNVNWCRT